LRTCTRSHRHGQRRRGQAPSVQRRCCPKIYTSLALAPPPQPRAGVSRRKPPPLPPTSTALVSNVGRSCHHFSMRECNAWNTPVTPYHPPLARKKKKRKQRRSKKLENPPSDYKSKSTRAGAPRRPRARARARERELIRNYPRQRDMMMMSFICSCRKK